MSVRDADINECLAFRRSQVVNSPAPTYGRPVLFEGACGVHAAGDGDQAVDVSPVASIAARDERNGDSKRERDEQGGAQRPGRTHPHHPSTAADGARCAIGAPRGNILLRIRDGGPYEKQLTITVTPT